MATAWMRASGRSLHTHAASKPSKPSRAALSVRAIGFDFGDEERESRRVVVEPAAPPPPQFKTFTLRASSLLVYQHVFKGAVGEAFLNVIATSQKFQAKNKDILDAYGRLYQLLQLSGCGDWPEYVLEQLLLARDNQFARAAAQGTLDDGAPLLQAAAYDLDVLQELSVPLAQLAEYVGDVAPTVGPRWVAAASSAATKRAPTEARLLGGGGGSAAAAAAPPAIDASSAAPAFIGRPAGEEEVAQWRAALAGHDRWGDAAGLLRAYHARHGFGITSRNSALRWSKGALEEGSEGAPAAPLLTATAQQRAALDANTLRHAAGLPAQHALLCGPPGSGKSHLVWQGSLAAGRDAGLRLVEVTAGELPNILEVARGCARYPRVRFILVADPVDLPLRGQVAADLAAGLGGAGGAGWPSNTLLYLCISSTSIVSYDDPLVQRCGLLLQLPELDEAGYLGALAELLPAAAAGAAGGSGSGARGADTAAALSGDAAATALEWARKHGGLSLRTAAMFARFVSEG